jgi:hypothetical protein
MWDLCRVDETAKSAKDAEDFICASLRNLCALCG